MMAAPDRIAIRPSTTSPEDEVLFATLPAARRIAESRFRIPRQEIDDVLQQAATDFLVQARRGARASAGLMIVITRRRCLDFWRSRYQKREVMFDERRQADPSYVMECEALSGESTVDGVRLARSWPLLSENCRHVLARRFWQNQRTIDLAERLGRKPGALKRMISRCLGRLRQGLGEAS